MPHEKARHGLNFLSFVRFGDRFPPCEILAAVCRITAGSNPVGRIGLPISDTRGTTACRPRLLCPYEEFPDRVGGRSRPPASTPETRPENCQTRNHENKRLHVGMGSKLLCMVSKTKGPTIKYEDIQDKALRRAKERPGSSEQQGHQGLL